MRLIGVLRFRIGPFLKMPPSFDVRIRLVMPPEVACTVAIMKRELRASIGRFAREPAHRECGIIGIGTQAIRRYIRDYLYVLTGGKAANGIDRWMTFEFPLDASKRPVRHFSGIVRAVLITHAYADARYSRL